MILFKIIAFGKYYRNKEFAGAEYWGVSHTVGHFARHISLTEQTSLV